MRQTTTTHFFSAIDGMRLRKAYINNIKYGERSNASPKIVVRSNSYVVIEFGTYFNPNDEEKITGFSILDYTTGEEINNENLLIDIMSVYKCWRYIYFKPILGKSINKQSVPLIKNWIKSQERFRDVIEKRRENQYNQISKVRDKEFVNVLKELDDEVINQYPYVNQKLKKELKIFERIYDIFSKPSLEFYQELINDIEFIAKMSNEENKIWTHRLKTWEKVYNYRDLKIKRLPEPSFKAVKLGFFGDIIDYFILKQQLYPVGGATIAGLTIEGSKKARKETMNFLNKYITYHYFGINAIKKNIEINNELKKLYEVYKNIWRSTDLSKVRNLKK